jgi:cell wall assembly regulator SMI1
VNANLEQVWAAFEASEVAPGITGASILSAGASEAAIREFEQTIGSHLPHEIFESYLRHDGQRENIGYFAFPGGRFLSLRQSVAERAERLRVASELFGPQSNSGPVRPNIVVGPAQRDLWRPRWVPIVKRNKEPICVDLEPAPGGHIGQLVEVDWEGGSIQVIAPSFTEFLSECVERGTDA